VFCPNCGANNPDTATVCAQCNQPIPQFSSTPPTPPAHEATPQASVPGVPGVQSTPTPRPPDVPNYLVHSIILAVCSMVCCALTCGFGFPAFALAIVALIFSAQVNSKLSANDLAGAQAASKNAKLFNWIALGLLLAGVLLYCLLLFFGAISNYWERH